MRIAKFILGAASLITLALAIGSNGTEVIFSQETQGTQVAPEGLEKEPALKIFETAPYDDILVEEVIAGDTLELGGGQILKLIGVDTPEIKDNNKLGIDERVSGIQKEVLQAMGKEAMNFTAGLVKGKSVKIEFDKKEKDFYGVLQGYAFLNDKDKTFVNAEIIKKGYARLIDTAPNFKYKSVFEELFAAIHEESVGLWKQWQK